jgi:hypothetical protein
VNNINIKNGLIALILIVVLITSVFAFTIKTKSTLQTISALERKQQADSLGQASLPGSVCYAIMNKKDMTSDGKCSCWEYRYSRLNGYNMTIAYIYAYANGTVTQALEQNTYNISEGPSEPPGINTTKQMTTPIEKCSVDSTDAMQIAMQNETVREFIHRYPNYQLDVSLHSSNFTTGSNGEIIFFSSSIVLQWSIGFQYSDPDHERGPFINIIIDPTTGNILYMDFSIIWG